DEPATPIAAAPSAPTAVPIASASTYAVPSESSSVNMSPTTLAAFATFSSPFAFAASASPTRMPPRTPCDALPADSATASSTPRVEIVLVKTAHASLKSTPADAAVRRPLIAAATFSPAASAESSWAAPGDAAGLGAGAGLAPGAGLAAGLGCGFGVVPAAPGLGAGDGVPFPLPGCEISPVWSSRAQYSSIS